MYQLLMSLLHNIPEGILIFYVGLYFVMQPRPLKLVALLGLIYGLSLTLARELAPPGYHVPFVLAVSMALNHFGARLTLGRSMFASLATFVVIALSGMLVAYPVMTWLGFGTESILSSVPLSLLAAWLEDAFLLAAALFAARYYSRASPA